MSVRKMVCKRLLSRAGGGGLALLVAVLAAGCDYFSPEGDIRDQLSQSVSSIYLFYSTEEGATTAMDSAKDGDGTDYDSKPFCSRSFLIDTRHAFSEIPDPPNPDSNDWQFLGWKFHSSYTGSYTGEWDGDADDVAGFSNFTLDGSGYVQEVTVSPMYARFYAEFGVHYTIRHRKQNLTRDGYDDMPQDDLDRKGVPGSSVRIPPDSDSKYEGFALADQSLSTIPEPTDVTPIVVVLTYDRKQYMLTLNANGGADTSGGTTVTQRLYYDVPTAIAANGFARTGYTFMGWATSADRADSGTVDYADCANYAIGAANATLYAVWKPNIVSITVGVADSYEVGIAYSQRGNVVTLTARLPNGAKESDYTYLWFITRDSPTGTVLGTSSTCTVDTSGWTSGSYEISLFATKAASSALGAEYPALSGSTVQIVVGD